MNWKPKKGVGKTLYVIETFNVNFTSTYPYSMWSNDGYYPNMTKYNNVMIITNGNTDKSTYIVAKKNKDTEYKTYKIKKINTVDETKQGIILMKGQNVIISNDKKIILKELITKYKNKEKLAREDINNFKEGKYKGYFQPQNTSYMKYITDKFYDQPKYVMLSYKKFLQKLKEL